MRRLLAVALLATALPAAAHWESAPAAFPWASPGGLRWLIDYATMDRPHVEEMVGAGFNLLQGGSFTPAARAFLAEHREVRAMQYICSRTIYHEKLFPKYPELKDAAILNPDGSYKIIYNNPARYAGCWNRDAWLKYVEGLMDQHVTSGDQAIFFDNPMTWACYCPTCQELFTKFALEHTGKPLKLNQFGKPTELEYWFTIDTAVRFWQRIHAYARAKGVFIVANNLSYWLVNQGLTDGVFTEGWGHAPFAQDIAAFKIGLAASHGRPVGVLDYIPVPVRQQRGGQEFNASKGSGTKWVGAPIAEEYELGYAQGLACGGNYLPNYSLELGRRIELHKDPEDARIIAALGGVNRFQQAHPEVFTDRRPGADLAVYYDLTGGPRAGEILGLNRGKVNQVLWSFIGAGLPAEVIVADDLTPERLAGLRSIVLSGVDLLEPAAAKALAEFVRGGGTLVLAGPAQVRERLADDATRRPLTDYLPGVQPVTSLVYGLNALTLDGYTQAPPYVKAEQVGKASLRFRGQAGRYNVGVSYLDEDDGRGTFDLLVDGRTIATWQSDRDDNQVHTQVTPDVPLQPGQTVTVVGHAAGGEYARLASLRFDTAVGGAGWRVAKLGGGQVLQSAVAVPELTPASLDDLRARLRERAVVKARAQGWPAKLLLNVTRPRTTGPLCLHLVNYALRYDERYRLQELVPAGPVTLELPAGCKTARLLVPDAEPQALAITDGAVTVPAVKTYAVVSVE